MTAQTNIRLQQEALGISEFLLDHQQQQLFPVFNAIDVEQATYIDEEGLERKVIGDTLVFRGFVKDIHRRDSLVSGVSL